MACTRAICFASFGARVAPRPAQHRRRPLPPARGSSTRVDLGGEQHEVIHSAAGSDDVLSFFVQNHLEGGSHKTKSKRLGELMQVNLITTSPDETLAEAEAKMKGIDGMPVVDAAGQLVGVLSKKDFKKGGSHVKDVMSATPIVLGPKDKVSKAAHTMIDNKIHRVPIVEEGKLVGLVTRTDIFWALASENDRVSFFHEHGIDV